MSSVLADSTANNWAPDEGAANTVRQGDTSFTVLAGRDALDWSKTALKRSEWDQLWDECPWSTAFQSSTFFDVWTRNYRGSWSPLLVVGRRADGSLAGVMPLAAKAGRIVGAGAHQAEYQGWISNEAGAAAFIRGACDALTNHIPYCELRLRYLPPGIPTAAIEWLDRNRRAVRLPHRTRHLTTDPATIDAVLRKRGNKSKLNRLQRLGKVHFRTLSPDALRAEIDRIVTMYDFRQGALHSVCPFSDDVTKLPFHLDWLRTAPQQLHATGIYLDDRLISALLLVRSKGETHLAISAFCPEHASSSPSKLNIYLAARSLRDLGVAVLDLTPGDDPWKARFGSDERQVWDLAIYPTEASANAQRMRASAKELVRRSLARVGLSVSGVKGLVGALRSVPSILRGIGRRPHRPFVFCLGDLPTLDQSIEGRNVTINSLQDLLTLGAKVPNEARGAFLRDALLRIERGDRCFIAFDLAPQEYCVGWVRGRPPSPEDKVEVAVFDGFRLSRRLPLKTARACLDAMVRDVARLDPPERFAQLHIAPDQEEVLLAAANEIGLHTWRR